MKNNSKVTIHMVSSLDGFIAKNDGNVTWMHSNDKYEKGIKLSDEDISEFLKGIDCYLLGAHTYNHALQLGWPYGNTPVKVLTHRSLPKHRENVEFLSGDLATVVNDQLKPKYDHIWMGGGALLAKELIRSNLADEIVISIMPIILGEGTLFFNHVGIEQNLHLKDVTAYNDGMVELCYEILK